MPKTKMPKVRCIFLIFSSLLLCFFTVRSRKLYKYYGRNHSIENIIIFAGRIPWKTYIACKDIRFFFFILELADLILLTRPFLQQISKAKAGRLVRTLVDLFLDLEAGTGREIDLIKECIEWAGNERRTFLKQALEARLMGLYADNERYEESLQLGKILRSQSYLPCRFLCADVLRVIAIARSHVASRLEKVG